MRPTDTPPLPPSARIALVGDGPTPRLIKLASALAAEGVSVQLFLMTMGYTGGLSPAHTRLPTLIEPDPQRLTAAIMDWQPSLVHLAPYSIHRAIWSVMAALRVPLILDPYDYHENCVRAARDSTSMLATGGSLEQAAFARADGLLARDLSLWNFCRVNHLRRRVPTLFFPDYCQNPPAPLQRQLPTASGPLRVAWVGSVMLEESLAQARETGAILIVEALARAGCEIHFYPHITSIITESVLHGFTSIAPTQIYFHQSRTPDALISEISQYNFGVHLMQSFFVKAQQRYLINDHWKYQISARCFDYLQAGLPMLTNPEFIFRQHYFKIPNFLVPIDREILASDPGLLTRWRAKIDRNALVAASQRYLLAAHIPRLRGFYARVLARARTVS